MYLKNLNELIQKDPSNIKIFIQDLPNLLFQSDNEPVVLFSKIRDTNDKKILCNLLSMLIKRLSVSSRRSKQAFTSLWDKLKRCLEIIMEDALINDVCFREDLDIEILLRRIVQLGVDVRGISSLTDVSMWLAMDLDVQLKEIRFATDLFNVPINPADFNSEMNQKSLFMYCQQFQIDKFPLYFKEIADPSPELINLYFKPQYYSTEITSELIELHDLKLEFIQNLKMLQASEWLKFDSNVLLILLSKLNFTGGKEVCVALELLTEIVSTIDLRPENIFLLKKLCEIQKMIKLELLADLALCKYWCFVSALLSCDGIEDDSLFNLEKGILFTLESADLVKSKTSVCRVIAQYWTKLEGKAIITELLMNLINENVNNKLKWNIAIALMNVEASDTEILRIKEFCLKELMKFDNFKLILFYLKLLLKWSDSRDLFDKDDFGIMWSSLNKLKSFIQGNVDNLECEWEDDENLVIENARKVEGLLKSILIGGKGGDD